MSNTLCQCLSILQTQHHHDYNSCMVSNDFNMSATRGGPQPGRHPGLRPLLSVPHQIPLLSVPHQINHQSILLPPKEHLQTPVIPIWLCHRDPHPFLHLLPFGLLQWSLAHLHWLQVKSCITYKVLLLTYKSFHGPAPQYIWDPLHQYAPPRTRGSSGMGPSLNQVATFRPQADTGKCLRSLPHLGVRRFQVQQIYLLIVWLGKKGELVPWGGFLKIDILLPQP